MLYFVDTEFSMRGPDFPVQLISIGIVDANGREYYAAVRDCDFDESGCNDFVKKYVLPKIKYQTRTDRDRIPNEIIEFCNKDKKPRFVGYHCAIDWTIMRQMFFPLGGMPSHWGHSCFDIRQLQEVLGWPNLPKKPNQDERHESLVDAQWTRTAYYHLKTLVDDKKVQLPREFTEDTCGITTATI